MIETPTEVRSTEIRPTDIGETAMLTGVHNTGSPPVEDLCKYFYKEFDNENLTTNDVNTVSTLKLNILNQVPEPLPLRSAKIFFLDNSISCFCSARPCLLRRVNIGIV